MRARTLGRKRPRGRRKLDCFNKGLGVAKWGGSWLVSFRVLSVSRFYLVFMYAVLLSNTGYTLPEK